MFALYDVLLNRRKSLTKGEFNLKKNNKREREKNLTKEKEKENFTKGEKAALKDMAARNDIIINYKSR